MYNFHSLFTWKESERKIVFLKDKYFFLIKQIVLGHEVANWKNCRKKTSESVKNMFRYQTYKGPVETAVRVTCVVNLCKHSITPTKKGKLKEVLT